MTATIAPALMTTEDLLAMPENGMNRWLIRGELREQPTTVRNRYHSRAMVILSAELEIWLRGQPEPRGIVLCGESGIRLRRNPDTTVGVDVAYVSADVAARISDDTTLIDGVPILAAGILSPSDTTEDIEDKVREYLGAGVRLVWIVAPGDRTVRIYRPDEEPEFLNKKQVLSGEPHLPEFRVPVARLFE